MKIRSGAVALAVAAVGASMLLVASPANADPGYDTAPLDAGVGWLQAQVATGPLQSKSSEFGNYDNIGATIDAALSLKEISGLGVPSSLIADVSAGVAGDAYGSYTDADEGAQHGYYANAIAKALAFSVLAEQNPLSFGGKNLVGLLHALIRPSGRIQDDSSYPDYANVFGQAFAVNGLYGAGQAADADSTLNFLATQQCSAGYFPENFGTAPNLDDTCDAKALTPDVDATATVVLELSALATPNPKATGVLNKAVSWLADTQSAEGSWDDNTNSTGLAGWALAINEYPAAAQRAAEWSARSSAGERWAHAHLFAVGDRGALALNDATFDAAQDGISDDEYNTYAVATAQALPVLKWLPAATSTPAINGPTGYVQGGTTATYQVSGFKPSARACLTGTGASSLVATDGTGAATVHRVLPASTGTSSVTVSDGVASSSVDTNVLGAATFGVTPSATSGVLGQPITIAVSGLGNAEAVSVTFQGQNYSGTATASGTFTTPVIEVLSAPGPVPITALGAFGNRTGSSSFVALGASTTLTGKTTPSKLTTAIRGAFTVTVTATGNADGGTIVASEKSNTLATGTVTGGAAAAYFAQACRRQAQHHDYLQRNNDRRR